VLENRVMPVAHCREMLGHASLFSMLYCPVAHCLGWQSRVKSTLHAKQPLHLLRYRVSWRLCLVPATSSSRQSSIVIRFIRLICEIRALVVLIDIDDWSRASHAMLGHVLV